MRFPLKKQKHKQKLANLFIFIDNEKKDVKANNLVSQVNKNNERLS